MQGLRGKGGIAAGSRGVEAGGISYTGESKLDVLLSYYKAPLPTYYKGITGFCRFLHSEASLCRACKF